MITSLPEDIHDRLLELRLVDPDTLVFVQRYTKAGKYVFFGKDKLHLLEDEELFNILKTEYVVRDLVFLLVDLLKYDKSVVKTLINRMIDTL